MRGRTPPPQSLVPPFIFGRGVGLGPGLCALFAPAILGSKFYFISFQDLSQRHSAWHSEGGPGEWVRPTGLFFRLARGKGVGGWSFLAAARRQVGG